MLNEERIILMTKMASYEANEGRRNVAIGNYFRGDYIGWHVLKSIISATIAFVVVFGMYIYYDFEVFMLDIYKMDILAFVKRVLSMYLWTIGIYAAVAFVVYAVRYTRAMKSLKLYHMNLRRLMNMYKA